MNDQEKQDISKLLNRTKDSVEFFSNKPGMKSYRERSVCAAFLRCLGVTFSVDDVIAQDHDPPDVIFRHANFEITDLYEEGRKRHKEYKDRCDALAEAKSIDETLLDMKWPVPISYEELFTRMKLALNKKITKSHYSKKERSSLDALVHVSLPHRFLDINSDLALHDELMDQGWRSVSFVIPAYSHVVFCNNNAPDFLAALSGKTRNEWKDPDTFFLL